MTAAVLCVGTELTRGEIVNTNATWLAEQLTVLGLDVAAVDVTGDDRGRIGDALRRLGEAHEVIVCTGGLGPTTDDLTSESVAALLGAPLRRDQASLAAIRERMERFGRRTITGSNAKQADFPEGATVLPNPVGTAPGFSLRIGRAIAFFLPGVPHEMRRMFADHVSPAVTPLARSRAHQVRLKTFGLAESVIADRLAGVDEAFGVRIGYRAHFPEIEIKLLALSDPGGGGPDVERRALRAAEEVRRLLGPRVVYGSGGETLPGVVLGLLASRGWTLAVADACTGGLLSHLLSEEEGAGPLAGSLAVREGGVFRAVLSEAGGKKPGPGPQPERQTREMARAVRGLFGTTVGLAVTGIADEASAAPEAPRGLIDCAVLTPDGATSRSRVYPASPAFVRRLAAFLALDILHTSLRGLPAKGKE